MIRPGNYVLLRTPPGQSRFRTNLVRLVSVRVLTWPANAFVRAASDPVPSRAQLEAEAAMMPRNNTAWITYRQLFNVVDGRNDPNPASCPSPLHNYDLYTDMSSAEEICPLNHLGWLVRSDIDGCTRCCSSDDIGDVQVEELAFVVELPSLLDGRKSWWYHNRRGLIAPLRAPQSTTA